MDIDEETAQKLEQYQQWHEAYFQGFEDAEVNSNFIIEELIHKIDKLEAQLSEFKNADGSNL